MNWEYKKGSIFDQDLEGKILMHSCNSQGEWGSGIAVEFKERFPKAFEQYRTTCALLGDLLVGRCLLVEDKGVIIACLIVSRGTSNNHDGEISITKATKRSFEYFLNLFSHIDGSSPLDIEIHMPKINSGRFEVPWDKTAKMLNEYNANVVVWEL